MKRLLFLHIVLACVLAGGAALAADTPRADAQCALTENLENQEDTLGSDALDWGGHDDEGDDEGGDGREFCICHIPQGNPGNAHTICVGLPALCAHLAHGDRLGPCEEQPQTCGGEDDLPCDDGQFCRRPGGECDAEGKCVDVPQVCPAVFAPVCGCNRITYDNACWAAAAEVSIASRGACEDGRICGGMDGIACDDGQFCRRPQGECAEDAEGRCVEIPNMCPAIFEPVCGCNERTYSNACFAAVAGVTVDFEGACEEPVTCGGTAGDTCETGEFCKRPAGECEEDAEGLCKVKPEICPDYWEPVCGCDRETYDNPCFADRAGVSIASKGECEDEPRLCGGTEGDTCEDDEFCKPRLGDCAEDAVGVCTEVPMGCPGILQPVCGCNGTTYDNKCLADGAGVGIAAIGECKDPVFCGDTTGDTCGDGEYCRQLDGECSSDDEGVCMSKPENCPLFIQQVCGCDDATYDNKCFAAAAGANVLHDGPCRMQKEKSIHRSRRRTP